MNLVRLVWNKKTFIASFLMGATIVGARYALIPGRIEVYTDQKLSQEVQTVLKNRLAKSSLRLLGAKGVYEELQDYAPIFSEVSISYTSSLTARVMVKAYMPRVRFVSTLPGHKDYVVCDNGQVVEKSYFREEVTQGMPTLNIAGSDFEDKRLDRDIIECVLQLKSDLFEHYVITWRSKSEIILQSSLSNSILIGDNVTVHDRERIRYAEKIYEMDKDLYKRGMKADLRLGDSIVCAPREKYEKSINL